MSQRHLEQEAREISAAIEAAGVKGVHVEVDEEEVTYLDGEVKDSFEEALAVEAAIKAGAVEVVDGLTHPGTEKSASHFKNPNSHLP